jgi:GntR family transcriptional regulator
VIFTVEQSSPVPISEQIYAQVIYGIASGALPPGELIPSVRDLALELRVHPNTVAKAYRDLVREGRMVVPRPGRGLEVMPNAPAAARKLRQQIVSQRLRHVLREMMSTGLPRDEIRQLVEDELSRVDGQRRVREKP